MRPPTSEPATDDPKELVSVAFPQGPREQLHEKLRARAETRSPGVVALDLHGPGLKAVRIAGDAVHGIQADRSLVDEGQRTGLAQPVDDGLDRRPGVLDEGLVPEPRVAVGSALSSSGRGRPTSRET